MRKDFERKLYKEINRLVTEDQFEDRDTNEYIYASISQPPIKVLDRHKSSDELKWTVECPTCKSPVNYGTELFMYKGYHYCNNKGCEQKLKNRVGR